MLENAVINASPLIYLCKSRLLHLLPAIVRRTVVPPPVLEELGVKEASDGCLQSVLSLPVAPINGNISIPSLIGEWDLGHGESSVLAYAYNNPGTVAILDDLAARRCAEVLGLPLLGTVGLVLRAKKNGIIASAFETLSLLKSNGMYLSDQIIAEVLELVGERIK